MGTLEVLGVPATIVPAWGGNDDDLALCAQFCAEMEARDPTPGRTFGPADAAREARDYLSAKHARVFFAKDDEGAPLGQIVVNQVSRGVGSVGGLYLRPGAPRGTWYLLMRAGYHWMRFNMVWTVEMAATPKNARRARTGGVYRRLGFRPTGEVPGGPDARKDGLLTLRANINDIGRALGLATPCEAGLMPDDPYEPVLAMLQHALSPSEGTLREPRD